MVAFKTQPFTSLHMLCYVLVLITTCGAFIGCSGEPAPVAMPQIDAQAAGQAAITQYDADGDGKISGKELDRVPSLQYALASIGLFTI